MKYVHTNIVTDDWRRLARFYTEVFECVVVPPERDQSGAWLERGTGVPGAHLRGVHLRLPGHGPDGPTLEIYTYDRVEPAAEPPVANRRGLGHLAFAVADVEGVFARVLDHGGARLGEVTTVEVEALGTLTFAYVLDPDGNVIELQHWG